MKRYWARFGLLSAVILVGSLPALAHEECDDAPEAATVAAQNGESRVAGSQTAVTVKLFQYQPGRIQVKAGTTVTWVNEDAILHTVTADKKHGGFDAPLDGKGKRFSFTFMQPGTYAYHCDRHEHMRGEIEVR